jgi:hypothetical protein
MSGKDSPPDAIIGNAFPMMVPAQIVVKGIHRKSRV